MTTGGNGLKQRSALSFSYIKYTIKSTGTFNISFVKLVTLLGV